jgi:uncharacterized protein
MFGTILTTSYTLFLLYVLWRASSVPSLKRRFSRRGWWGLGVSLWLFFLVARGLRRSDLGAWSGLVEQVGMILLAIVFIFASLLLIVDLATLFGFFFRKQAPTLRGAGLAVGSLLCGVALIQGFRPPAIVSYEVHLKSLPAELNGKVLVAVSDAHLGKHLGVPWFDARVEQMRALRPDLLLFLGDIFDGVRHAPKDLASLRGLEVPLGKWYVDGNHEHHGSDGSGLDVLERAGFQRLSDRWASAAPGLVLAGVDDLTRRSRRSLDDDPVGRALQGRPEGAAIFLSHTPWGAPRAAKLGAGLMLSGHTHGGQVWPFNYLVQTKYPLLAGRYDLEGMTVIVSRGMGTWGPRMRLWHRGEILRIVLRSQNP